MKLRPELVSIRDAHALCPSKRFVNQCEGRSLDDGLVSSPALTGGISENNNN